jgi:hypothetical protein
VNRFVGGAERGNIYVGWGYDTSKDSARATSGQPAAGEAARGYGPQRDFYLFCKNIRTF